MSEQISSIHLPVLAQQCVDLLMPALEQAPSVMIDATVGLGGHSELMLSSNKQVQVVGIDRDPSALTQASKRLEKFGSRFIPFLGTYDQIPDVASEYGTNGKVDAILMDLGVSSLQLDSADRGFSYSQEAPLDMRMNQSEGVTAAQILAEASESDLREILHLYGEEKFAGRIARNIVRRRETKPFLISSDLVEVVSESIPAPARRTGGNPSKRTFQALRIAVNNELDILRHTIPAALHSLRIGGRLVVESYQSLEDRIVKRVFSAGTQATAPVGMPVIREEDQPYLLALTKGAVKATAEDIVENPRSKPVRLRAVEVIRTWRP